MARLAGPAARLVHAFKFDGWTVLSIFMARGMRRVRMANPALRDTTCVTWIPTTPKRFRDRGFNPARVLAEAVAEGRNDLLVPALRRVGEGPRQAALPASERGTNVCGAFAFDLPDRTSIHNHHVLLVDDVLTTGATVSEASRVLLHHGARSVAVLTFARALEPLPGSGWDAA